MSIFANYNSSTYRENAVIFKNIEYGDKLRWEKDKNGNFVPKIDKTGIFQGLKRTWRYYLKNDDEAEGIEASKKAIEFARSFNSTTNTFINLTNYQTIVKEDRNQNTKFPFEDIGKAFIILAETYNTANSSWRKDSDEKVRENYLEALKILNEVIESANEYITKLSKGSSPIKIPSPSVTKLNGLVSKNENESGSNNSYYEGIFNLSI